MYKEKSNQRSQRIAKESFGLLGVGGGGGDSGEAASLRRLVLRFGGPILFWGLLPVIMHYTPKPNCNY